MGKVPGDIRNADLADGNTKSCTRADQAQPVRQGSEADVQIGSGGGKGQQASGGKDLAWGNVHLAARRSGFVEVDAHRVRARTP